VSRPGHTPGPMLVHRVPDEDDDREQFKPLEWGLVRRVFGYTRPVRGKVWLLVFLTLSRSAQLTCLTWIAARVISGPIARGDLRGIMAGTLAYAALGLLTDAMFHFRQRYALEVGERVVNGLRSEIFAKVQRQPMRFFSHMRLGRILSRATSDVEAVRVGIQDVAFATTVQGGQMLFAGCLMAWWDWKLFLVVVGMAPILWYVNNHFRMKYSRLSRSAQDSFSRVTATLAESVSGIRVTQGFVRQDVNAGLFRSLLADHSRYNIALARTSAILAPLLELNSQFFVAILLMLGGWRVFHGGMDLANLIMFFLMANMFFSPITTIGNQYNLAITAMASAERIFWLVDMEPDWEDDPDARDLPEPPTPRGARVEFRDVSFAYDAGRTVLHGISFTAEPGQAVALVGHTGSGKSSIINLVSKFYLPGAGEVLVDGLDIRKVTSRSLHRRMGMVQQQNFLFSGTLLDNLRMGRPDATEEDALAAVAGLDWMDILEALPRGLHTEVGERGAGLSLGQRQLVCFTRAFLADPRIVILDEATSSIDALTEARLQKALVTLLRGRTSFVVAHRLSTIRHADLVLVLDQGRIVERGTHLQLLAAGGPYAALHRQFVQMDV
jgi:ABC-type multidrug transport system fused ATPase/permease subunit